MRVIVFGAAGNVGSRVVAEALSRGHEVAAVVRDPNRFPLLPDAVKPAVGDAGNFEVVARLTTGHDVAIGATRPSPGNEQQLLAMAKGLLAGTARTGVRLLLVGGAGSLIVPDTGRRVVDDPRYVAPAWRDIALACCDQFEVCRADARADWTYLSPPALLRPGTRTGKYRLGGDELLLDADGASSISMEDFAVALLDEVEHPRHRQTRFTVAY